MICPSCRADAEPVAVEHGIAVLACCGETVIDGRSARYSDIAVLDDGELARLRAARTRIARPGRVKNSVAEKLRQAQKVIGEA